VSPHWASPCKSAEFPTDLKRVVTLLINSLRALADVIGLYVTGGDPSSLHTSYVRPLYRTFLPYPTESVVAMFVLPSPDRQPTSWVRLGGSEMRLQVKLWKLHEKT
jgi:hypothetical protein